ncbi:hypothetical protein [Pararhodobacter sp.]|uniref:hypothetical protein n=1 Tax=Pararhodobacter sp. TaxID=2127056 RepID=UPI002FE20F55|nr:hypothetical protein [Pseudomonadota bacterium]
MSGDRVSKNAGPAGPDGARRVKAVRGTKGDDAREARVKAALKANIARRKAQAKARGESEDMDE